MSYACQDIIGNVLPVSRVNYFSNPNVTVDNKPTGTATENCARRISETKVRIVGALALKRWTLVTCHQIHVVISGGICV